MKKATRNLVLVLGSLVFAVPAQAAFINGNVSIIPLDNVQSFSFFFSTPIAPLVGPVAWTANVSGSLIEGGRDGVSLAPYFSTSIYEFLIDDVLVAADALGTVTADYATSFSGFYDCGAGCASLQMRIRFTTSGGGDSYNNIFGEFLVDETDLSVAEPGIAALFGIGLASLAVARRRRLV